MLFKSWGTFKCERKTYHFTLLSYFFKELVQTEQAFSLKFLTWFVAALLTASSRSSQIMLCVVRYNKSYKETSLNKMPVKASQETTKLNHKTDHVPLSIFLRNFIPTTNCYSVHFKIKNRILYLLKRLSKKKVFT